jgi:hypothetical protein
VLNNRLPTAVAVRSPLYETRASPRPASAATRKVAFRVDQILISHNRAITSPSTSTFHFSGRFDTTVNTKPHRRVAGTRCPN